MRITVTRRGGIAGVALSGSGTTDELPADEAAAAQQALARTDWGAVAARPQHPDAFTYDVTLEQDGDRRSRTFAEHELPDELRPLVRHLLA